MIIFDATFGMEAKSTANIGTHHARSSTDKPMDSSEQAPKVLSDRNPPLPPFMKGGAGGILRRGPYRIEVIIFGYL
jgi:hypothetical protein